MVIPHSEPELIALLKQGSQEAFKSLYDLYARRLYAFCMEYTKSREDTEEIVQDAFIWLWRNKETIRQEATIKNLLFLRVKHFLINAWRARVNEPIFEDYVNYLNLPSDGGSDPMEYDEFQKKIISIINQLPPTKAKIMKLSRIDGYRNKEIAEKLKLSEQTVKNAVVLGMKHLRSKLKSLGIMVLLYLITCL